MKLLYEASAQKQAFVEACAWAEDIHMCLAWLEPGDAQGPAFSDLEPHQHKVRQAIVGLTRLQSHPALLRRLHHADVLRLVSSVDGSFSPNLYVFRRGDRVRTLVTSAPFTASRLSKPCESFVVFEAPRDDALSLQSLQLLDRCRALAHVPSRGELDAYEHAWAEARSGGVPAHSLMASAAEVYDTSALGPLTAVEHPDEIRDALVEVRRTLSQAAAVRLQASYDRCVSEDARGPVRLRTPANSLAEASRETAGPKLQGPVRLRTPANSLAEASRETAGPKLHGPGPTRHGALYWVPLGYWAALRREDRCFELDLGLVAPWEVARPTATASLTSIEHPHGGSMLRIGTASTGERLLLQVSDRSSHDDVDLLHVGGTQRAAVLGNIDSKDLVQTMCAFVQRVRREHKEGDFT
jgi:hypothetical protein